MVGARWQVLTRSGARQAECNNNPILSAKDAKEAKESVIEVAFLCVLSVLCGPMLFGPQRRFHR